MGYGWMENQMGLSFFFIVGIKIMDISTYKHIYKLSLTFMGFKIDVKLGSWDFIFKIHMGIRVFFYFHTKTITLEK